MSLLRRFGASLSGAVLALVLPLSQAQAQDCVRLKALNHCGIGAAHLSLTGEGVLVENGSYTGEDGVAIHTGPISGWSAAAFVETDAPESKTVLSSVSEGTVTSATVIDQRGESIAFGASFTSAGSKTYAASVYSEGRFIGIQSGISLGFLGPVTYPSLSYRWSPSCRPIGQTYMQCRNVCHRYGSCDYCSIPCRNGFNRTAYGAAEWRFALAYSNVKLPDGRVLQGDELVLTEELDNPGTAAPVCDEIRLQTTAKATTLFESFVVGPK